MRFWAVATGLFLGVGVAALSCGIEDAGLGTLNKGGSGGTGPTTSVSSTGGSTGGMGGFGGFGGFGGVGGTGGIGGVGGVGGDVLVGVGGGCGADCSACGVGECCQESCSGACSCPGGCECDYACDTPPCFITCSNESGCLGECAMGTCTCKNDSVCIFTCKSAPCEVTCTNGADCQAECAGDGEPVGTGGGGGAGGAGGAGGGGTGTPGSGECNCLDSDCEFICTAPPCDVTCAQGATCSLDCNGLTPETAACDIACTGSKMNCGNGVITCDKACP